MSTLFAFPSKNQLNAQGAVTENPGTLTLRVQVKEPTEDEKHSGSDHPRRFTQKYQYYSPRSSGEEV